MPTYRRGGWHGWESGKQPAWWPEGEQFPPQHDAGREAWEYFGRRVATAVFVVLVVVLSIVAALGFGISYLVNSAEGADLSPVALIVGLNVFGILVLRRVFRRTLLPARSLVRAAGRLADGDYTARVARRGSRSLRSVSASFNSMAERLEQAEDQRRRLMSDLSHELRTPLAIIRGEVEAVIDGVRDGGPDHMASLLDEVETLERLIDDLRLVTLSDEGRLELQLESVDLVDVVEEVADSYVSTAAAVGVKVAKELDDSIPVHIDVVRVRQALTNLAVNSLRAMPDGGTLTFSMAPTDAHVIVRVSDTGGGITVDGEPFDRFVKASDSPGSGLGLSISRSIARAHGGDLVVVRTGPDGTLMQMTFPQSARSQ